MPNVVWSRKATKQLLKIDTRYQQKIIEKVAELSNFPQVQLDITALQGESGKYRIRIGDYRVIFEWINDEEPQIINIQKVARRSNRTYRP